MPTAKRVLLLAPYFLPRRRVGSMRPFRFAIHLSEFGWEPHVLTIAAPDQQLTEKEARLLEDVCIRTIHPPFDRTRRSESQLGAAAAPAKQGSRLAGMAAAVDRQFPVDTWLLLFSLKYRQIVRIVTEIDPDVIWATGDPWSGLVVGSWLSRRLDTPYVADFRDPWTLSEIRTSARGVLARTIDPRIERSVMASADLVLFQAEQVEAAYRAHYADLDPTTLTIHNSFDPDVFDDPVGPTARQGVQKGDGLHIGFFGRFRAMSPATLVIDALVALRARHGEKADRIFIHSFGRLSDEDAEYARVRGVSDQFVAEQAVPLERALGVLRTFDVLLVSTESRRERIIPAKLFEYLAAGRPILSLSRNPEVARILEETGTGVQIHDPQRTADLLAACVEAVDHDRPLPIPFAPLTSAIKKYEARATTRDLAAALDGLMDRSRA